MVAGGITYGCRWEHIRLQAGSHTVAGSMTHGCRQYDTRLQAVSPVPSTTTNSCASDSCLKAPGEG
eukprot:scaffold80325_cov42-Phaeocystis_antarctica.AAC.1